MAPADLFSSNGKLSAEFAFRNSLDAYGNTRYCYIHEGGAQAPTLRVHPGDKLLLKLKNELRPLAGERPGHGHAADAKKGPCAGRPMTAVSTNLHFHGINVAPVCHQDEVLHTLIEPSDAAFQYSLKIPLNQPPGLYWYHPHPHGYSEPQVVGGASGAIIVEGIERVRPEVAGLPERVLVLRDQLQGEKWEGSGEKGEDPRDISINFVPIVMPHQAPAELRVRPQQREFWRVLNASAGTYFNLQVLYRHGPYDFIPEHFQVIALDGAPIGGDTATLRAPRTDLLIPPGGRAEFIVTTPPVGIPGRFVTRWYATGPDGLVHPERIIANLISSEDAPAAASTIPGVPGHVTPKAMPVRAFPPARHRRLYFSEDRQDQVDPKKPAKYFITVEGQSERAFDMNFKVPDIVAQQGTVEDWEIENRAREGHTFHIHQLHFQVLERDGVTLHEPELRDTIDLPFWDGKGPYPKVKLRMDFRNPEITGTFIYHCHILEHEDGGMMGSIEVRRR